MNDKPSYLDYISLVTKAILATICVLAICAAMFYKNYSDPATLSALFLLTGTLVGGLRGSTSSKSGNGSDSETTITQKTETVTKPKAPVPDPTKPQEVIVSNPISDPVVVTEVKPEGT